MYAPLWVHNTKLQRWISLTRSFSRCSSTSQSTSLLLSPPCWCVKERALVIPRGQVAIIEVIIGHCPPHRTTTKRLRFSPMSKKIVLAGSLKDWFEAQATDQWRQKHDKGLLNKDPCQSVQCNFYVNICVCILYSHFESWPGAKCAQLQNDAYLFLALKQRRNCAARSYTSAVAAVLWTLAFYWPPINLPGPQTTQSNLGRKNDRCLKLKTQLKLWVKAGQGKVTYWDTGPLCFRGCGGLGGWDGALGAANIFMW